METPGTVARWFVRLAQTDDDASGFREATKGGRGGRREWHESKREDKPRKSGSYGRGSYRGKNPGELREKPSCGRGREDELWGFPEFELPFFFEPAPGERTRAEDVQDPIEKKYTFISDMQKGFDVAMKEVCDGASHKFCSRHIWANLSKNAKCNGDELRRAFWNCAKATTSQRFKLCMNALRRIDLTTVEYLGKIDPSRWTMSAFDCDCKNDALTSNMCEQFNKELLKVMGKPILSLVEGVKEYITRKKIRCQTLLARYNGFFYPKVQARLEEHMKKSNGWVPL
ncbi:hypothetical protein CRG98_002940 [Punica granatum]|uniref:MULE transposase domain-containing protein n=1 Tax=Punica granatum TaxID=22663 RepID=A0A2I0L7G9_PUNGR|nr:hypothetical protein CRG98_002940 [Punica granatum]